MKREEYFRLLQKPYDWDLQESEKALAVEMAKIYGGREILDAWREFQQQCPLDSFQRFEKWYLNRNEGAASAGPNAGDVADDSEDIDTGAVSVGQLELEMSPFAEFYRKTGRIPKNEPNARREQGEYAGNE